MAVENDKIYSLAILMVSDLDTQEKDPNKYDPEFQTENIAFDPREMIRCGACGRTNPPNRFNCIYCGRDLSPNVKNPASKRTNLRKLELWENGYNVIAPATNTASSDVDRIAFLLSMDPAKVRTILDGGCSLPLARVENEREAEVISELLMPLGISCSLISDAELSTHESPVRLGTVDVRDNNFALKDFNTGNVTEIAKNDLALIVTGSISTAKIDSLENKGRKGKSTLINETITANDESIVDLYSRRNGRGFRVQTSGFDFSGLGNDKGLLATENIRSLIDLLKSEAPHSTLINNYLSVRHALGIVWETETRKDSKGLLRAGFGKREFAAIATTNNGNQFTKYSRLQWHLL